MSSLCKHPSLRIVCGLLFVFLLGGCATKTPGDPFERVNRGIYSFNESVDNAIVKPVARAYRAVIPQFIRSSVSNFFSNINDIVVALNNLLQGKFTAAYADFGRVAMNSTLGIGGLFDIASEAGVEKHDEDFGQTLGRWGVGGGPFLMLPIFGPSNVRDVFGRVVDYRANLVTYVDPSPTRYSLWGTNAVERRSELLDASTVLQTAALDQYEFVRDGYLQRRRNLIQDGTLSPLEKDVNAVVPARTSNLRDPVLPAAEGVDASRSPANESRVSELLAEDRGFPPSASAPTALAALGTAAPAAAPAERMTPRVPANEPLVSVNGEAFPPTKWGVLEPFEQRPAAKPVPTDDRTREPMFLVRLWRSWTPFR